MATGVTPRGRARKSTDRGLGDPVSERATRSATELDIPEVVDAEPQSAFDGESETQLSESAHPEESRDDSEEEEEEEEEPEEEEEDGDL